MDSLSQRLSRLRAAWRGEQGWTEEDKTAWAEQALRVALARVEAQRNEVVRIRSQSMLFVTFLGAALAFLIGAVVNPLVDRTPLFFQLAGWGTGLLVVLGVLLFFIVAPVLKFNFTLDAKTMLGWRTEGPLPATSYFRAVEALAGTTLQNHAVENRKRLVWLRWLLAGLLAAGLASLSIWIWVLWACT